MGPLSSCLTDMVLTVTCSLCYLKAVVYRHEIKVNGRVGMMYGNM